MIHKLGTVRSNKHNDKIHKNGYWAITSLIIIITLFLFQFDEEQYDPIAIFLTWQQDPTTTMTIDWHTIPEDGERESVIEFKKMGEDEDQWERTEGASHPFPHSDRMIHRVEITGLDPGTTYRFRFGKDSKEFKFRTMPADLDEPIRFVAGGDTGYGDDFIKMNQEVMKFNPDFIVWGGDISYANGDPALIYRWYGWFDGIKESLIDEDGKVIPIVIVIGNHELFGVRRLLRGSGPHHEHTREEADAYMEKHDLWDGKPTYFFDLFAFPGRPSYNVLDFGDYMSLIALDSNHYSDVAGEQTDWLEETLAEREDRNHIFPVYHVPAYPSHREFSGSGSRRVRENWVPLFEEYGIRVALENHDHTYKRTWPIKNNQLDEDGVVYIGDGSWVQGPSDGDSRDEWYINEFASLNHGIIVELQEEMQNYTMVSSDGNIFDTFNPHDPVDLPLMAPMYEPELIWPQSAPRVDLQPEFEWEEVTNAFEYNIQVAQGNFGSGLLLDSIVNVRKITYPEMLEKDETYRWRVQALNEIGTGPWSESMLFFTIREEATSADNEKTHPSEFTLHKNYPNPFNPETTIRYGIPVSSHVDLRVFDIIGREVTVLVNETKSAGNHEIVFDSDTMPSGVYIFRIEATPAAGSNEAPFIQTHTMTLIK